MSYVSFLSIMYVEAVVLFSFFYVFILDVLEDLFHLSPNLSRNLDESVIIIIIITKPALRGNILMPFFHFGQVSYYCVSFESNLIHAFRLH